VGRGREREELVRENEVAAELPAAARRHRAGNAAVESLRGSRLLTALKERARSEGFDAFGITEPSAPAFQEYFEEWLARGSHGDMDWLARTKERRADPHVLWPDAKSVIVLGVNYGPDENPLALLDQRERGAISVYARSDDYHELIKGKLKRLGQWLIAKAGGEIKVFVDTAPVMEKPLAASAGLGWQGKHTNLISREFGSWLFLGSIFTTLELPFDQADADHCGSCRACLDICPTNAFPAPYQLDATRCISYLTIEHKGPIPRELRAQMGNRIYGCDDCLAVCPWNKFAQAGHEAKLAARGENRAPRLADLAKLDDAAFRARFAKSPIKRTGRDRFIRNVLIAIGNSADVSLAADAERLLTDESPLVRGAAVWALSKLAPEGLRIAAQSLQSREQDESVREEWAVAFAA
jgi:epoxyqueuosine reductase